MVAPKPVAPSKPLSFRPPEKPKAAKKPKQRGQRVDIAIFDEHLGVKSGEEGQKAIFDFSTKSEPKIKAEKPKKPFVLDPRMTQRPFQDDRLMQLKNSLQRPSFKNS
jgi:hypothetical protein